ncbi:hypothetical protein C3V36_03190 [Lachnospiraceae bacterium oral taxon 500]|nr:hypothetical protein C3V36_03190 [Lachnospiraceae bacterium oral taxon 500]
MKPRRFLVFVLIFSLFLAACSPAQKDHAIQSVKVLEPIQLTLWHYYVGQNQQTLEDAIVEFNQTLGTEENIIIESVSHGSVAELEASLSNSAKGVINSAPMPDIFSCYPDKALEIDALGMIADLNPYFTDEEKAGYVSSFLADGYFDNRLLILPIAKSTELLYINATAWNEFADATGLSHTALETWESIWTTAQKYYDWTDRQTPDTPNDGRIMLGMDSVQNYILAGCKQSGVDMVDAETKNIILNLPVLRKLFDLYISATAMHYFGGSGKFRSDNIKSGELISYIGSTSSASYFPTWIQKDTTRQNIQFLALPYPLWQGGEPTVMQQGAGMCITKSTAEKERAAALFLKWFTGKEQNMAFAMNSGYLPVKADIYRGEDFKDALQKLDQGNESQKNVAMVYDIAFQQVSGYTAYAVRPFKNSYMLRPLLLSTLTSAAESAQQAADTLKKQKMSSAQILSSLNLEQRFADWIESLEKALQNEGISYQKI